ncbi:MAG: hypothetical protein FJZ64_04085 [Chlamydiae bacterium]|nr:hypothetical protein [Chlamydiota bacterium]
MVSKTYFINTQEALASAGNLANQILQPASTSNSTTVHHEHYHWGSPFWGWGYHPYPAYCGPSGSSSGKRDTSWVALIAAPIALGSMYFIGRNHAEWSHAKLQIARLQAKQIDVQSETNIHPPLQNAMKSVFSRQLEVLNHQRAEAAKGLFYKGVFTGSVIAAGVGGVLSAPALLAGGAVGALVTGGVMLYRAGFRSQDPTLFEDASGLKRSVQVAQEMLRA